ncbi:transporter substrate-binding domain-containing protein [Microvirga puerhi]|uniref:Transporter substrate-binding domain-containing protein n=1 Tax=Microvirga puerhi TaxID=2876078 RepID=A0ABS7VL89_9HYPH|nr:transporter substrate-binding domain-containing protein [Microvirga puerhi]MBZ6075713.1 transporter substrate-binding domain-containing protein [Microvirga puerhi]
MQKFRLMTGLAIGALIAGLTFQASSALAKEPIKLPQQFESRKSWNVGMETNSPPMEYEDIKSGKLTGFNVELVEAISAKLGLELKLQTMDVPSMSPALDSGRIDMIGSHFNDIPGRHRKLTFVDYLATGPVFYTTKENAAIYKEPAQLCGKALGAPEHTTYFRLIKEWGEKNCPADSQPVILGTKGLPDTQLQIRQGRLIAGAIGAEKINYWAEDPKNIFAAIGKPFYKQLYGFAFTRENAELRDAVKAALDQLASEGEYKRIIEKYKLSEQMLPEITIDKGED